MDESGIPIVIVVGLAVCDKEFIESMNDCDEMWVGEVEMRPRRKYKDLRSMSGGANHVSPIEFLQGHGLSESFWLKEEVLGIDVPNEKYMKFD